MDLHKMIIELQAERQRLDEAIEALERLSSGNLRRRGRPPRWLKEEIDRHAENPEATEPEPAVKKKPS
jgi:hypothetical protein